MTPTELAAQLGISPKTLRQWLRDTSSRSIVEHSQRWSLDQRQVTAARAHFQMRSQSTSFPRIDDGLDSAL